MLWIAAITSIAISQIYLIAEYVGIGVALIIINLITAFFTLQIIETEPPKVNTFIPPTNKVIRDGMVSVIRRSEIVRGDVIVLSAG